MTKISITPEGLNYLDSNISDWTKQGLIGGRLENERISVDAEVLSILANRNISLTIDTILGRLKLPPYKKVTDNLVLSSIKNLYEKGFIEVADEL